MISYLELLVQQRQASKRVFWVTLAAFVLAFYLLHHMFLYWEVAWHVIGAGRMLDGAGYLGQLWDDNGPFVFAIYLPVSLFFELFHSHSPTWVLCYTLLLLSLSLWGCWFVLQCKGVSVKVRLHYYGVSLFVLLIPALSIFGQREHIMMMLYFPYLYLQLLEFEPSSGQIISLRAVWGMVLLAIFSAIGFQQQPFYLVIPVALDLLNAMYRKQCVLRCVRYSFYLGVVVLLLLSYWLYPNYYRVILPLVAQFESGINLSSGTMGTILGNSIVMGVLGTWIIVAIWVWIGRRDSISVKLLLATTLSMAIFIWEYKAWYYHLYPALCFILLLWCHVVYMSTDATMATKLLARIRFSVIAVSSICVAMLLISGLLSVLWDFFYFGNTKSMERQLITYARKHMGNGKVFILHTRVTPTYVLPFYSEVNIVTPWSNNWELPGLVNEADEPRWAQRNTIGRRRLYQMTCATLQDQKPDYVLFPVAQPVPYLLREGFNYHDFLMQNECVKTELKHYDYQDTVAGFAILARHQ